MEAACYENSHQDTRTRRKEEILRFSHEDTRIYTKKPKKNEIIRGNSCNSWASFFNNLC
jgi:hypothetical protein